MNTPRAFHPAQDFAALTGLRQRVEAHDQDGVDASDPALRAQLAWPNHDPARDRWVVDDPHAPGELAAHGLTWLPPNSRAARVHIIVAPQWRRQGLGTALWALAVQRARQLGAGAAVSYVNGQNPAANAFLVKQGCTLDWPYIEMRRTAPQVPAGCLPPGFAVRSYAEVQDLPLLTRAMNEAYAGQAGHNETDEAEMAGWLADFSQPGLLLLFAPGGELAGISRTEVNADRSAANGCPTGYIDAPGLLPAYRSPETYRGLLRAGLAWLAGQGCAWVELEGWGEPPERLEMFAREGFSLLKHINAYSCRVGA